ncbi:hypothetical protein GCM10010094_19350 [Streptomyces flaveus]|uniref:Uncharacterized protein n=1 Tax=Streptomyces flaveus TaxID=66370 RepID=A0A917VBG1_9ACTN|nr:hypothetical protein GCM10010094_19350 [Streptomyces flaveus]
MTPLTAWARVSPTAPKPWIPQKRVLVPEAPGRAFTEVQWVTAQSEIPTWRAASGRAFNCMVGRKHPDRNPGRASGTRSARCEVGMPIYSDTGRRGDRVRCLPALR